jgi:hypothetical protein
LGLVFLDVDVARHPNTTGWDSNEATIDLLTVKVTNPPTSPPKSAKFNIPQDSPTSPNPQNLRNQGLSGTSGYQTMGYTYLNPQRNIPTRWMTGERKTETIEKPSKP